MVMGRAGRDYEVTVVLSGSTSVQEFAKIFEGLDLLRARGKIALKFQPARERTNPRLLHVSVRDRLRQQRVVIDVADDPVINERGPLDAVDVYFKRSYQSSEVAKLSPELRRKVKPLGLNNPAIQPAAALRLLGARLRTGRTLPEMASDARQLFALPEPRAFEVEPSAPAESVVFFQTRLWSPTTEDPDRHAINQERIELVRALRSAFGPRFLGGIVPSDFARNHAPDLITPLPWRMRSYPPLLRRPLIAVYSRGLRGSLAFKMSEYLAAARCIVGEAPEAELPQPLVDGTNYLGFTTPDECIAQCERLLHRPADAAAMRQANSDYYRRNVEPAVHLEDLLKRALGN